MINYKNKNRKFKILFNPILGYKEDVFFQFSMNLGGPTKFHDLVDNHARIVNVTPSRQMLQVGFVS